MSRATANKLYRTFVKGLVSEASPLTYPEDASTDEDNCVLSQNGNRIRRLGIDFETGYIPSTQTFDQTLFLDYAVREYVWTGANNIPGTNFYVQQIGATLYFYSLNNTTISPYQKSFTVDLTQFLAAGFTNVSGTEVEMVSGKGYLFVTGQVIEPFYIAYDPVLDTITTKVITIQIRDFQGVNDGLANDQEPPTLTPEHQYNLQNQGWVAPTNDGTSGTNVSFYDPYGGTGTYTAPTTSPITQFFATFNRYPGNNKQWWVAQAPTDQDGVKAGDFDPTLLTKFYFGTGHSPQGHYVVNAFKIDRSGVSGVPSLPVITTQPRPKAVSFFSGRVWFGLNNTLYFSQIIDDIRKVGFCYQDGDPTSQFISDLIATDGGVIPIPEMINVQKIVPIGPGLMCFAENGVWFVSGGSGGFSALNLEVSKISPIGTNSPNSVVTVEHATGSGSVANNTIYWWSEVGIQSISPSNGVLGPIAGYFQKTLVSQATIQTFFDDSISSTSKQFVKAVYDPASQVIQWFFKTLENTASYKYDRILNLNLLLDAFYPWTITSNSTSPWLIGGVALPHLIVGTTEAPVTAQGIAVTATTLPVTSPIPTKQVRSTFFKYGVIVPTGTTYQLTFGSFDNTNHADWQTFDSVGQAYTSYVETGFELLDDAMRNKQTPYVFVYMQQTENALVQDSPGQYHLSNPSSCFLTTKWNWTNTTAGNKWSTKVQVYRISQFPRFDSGDVFNNGQTVMVTKNKVRGNGKAIQFRMENGDIGTDFNIYGWSVEYTGATQP